MYHLSDKCQRFSFLAASASSANTVHVVVIGCRNIIVDNVRHIRNIKTSRSNIGRYENLHFIFLEFTERSLAGGWFLSP